MRVPASTSNLGPGFDCLGLALCLYNKVTVTREAGVPVPPMVAEAAAHFFERARRKPFAFSCAIHGDVPPSRGLGSSVTVRLGLLQGLNELAERPLDRAQLFEICARLEGHPDNAAPAAYGGFNVSRDNKRVRFAVAANVRFVLLIPAFEVETRTARRILPATIDRAGAVESCGNACMITAAFATRRYENLRGAFRDHLHQPFRQKLVPFLPRVVTAAEEAGALGAWLSGSGSAIAAMTLTAPDKVAKAMRSAVTGEARTLVTAADSHGARVMRIRSPHASLA